MHLIYLFLPYLHVLKNKSYQNYKFIHCFLWAKRFLELRKEQRCKLFENKVLKKCLEQDKDAT